MNEHFSRTIHDFIGLTWPVVIIFLVVILSLRITYLVKNHEKVILYRDLFMLGFMIYILCLFQIVTVQDINNYAGNNFIPFQEITRYTIGSRLFIKNILGNMLLFVPYGFFIGTFLKLDKARTATLLVFIVSLSIEITQMMIGRIFDIDDIILNIAGGLLGFILYKLLAKISDSIPNIFKKEWFLNTLMIIVVILLLFIII